MNNCFRRAESTPISIGRSLIRAKRLPSRKMKLSTARRVLSVANRHKGNGMSRTLIVLPDDTAAPLINAINAAKKSLRIKMFVFSDPSLLEAVVAAHKRGVDVRVMLNPERRDGEKENADIRAKLKAAGVAVIDSNPSFDVTHEKSMVIDDATAFIESLNWEPRNLTETRDYAI